MSAASVVTNWFRGKREVMHESEGEEAEEEEEEEDEEEEEVEEEAIEAKEDESINKNEDCTSMSVPTIPNYNHQNHHHHNGGGGMWSKTSGSRAAVVGRLKSKLFETRLATHVKQAHIAITDSLKQAGWAVENKVSEVSRRGWSEATRAWGNGGSGGATLALTGGSGGPHERSSLLLGPGDGYQRLDNNNKEGGHAGEGGLYPDLGAMKDDDSILTLEDKAADKNGGDFECSDGWGDEAWTSDWGGNGNNSSASSPTQTRVESLNSSPNARNAKKNNNNSTNKSKGSSIKSKANAEEELLVDLNGSGSTGGGGNNKGHTWDNWDDDWEKVDGQ